MFTTNTVKQTLLSHMESDLPALVMVVLRQYDGKPLTKRLLAKLPGGESEWHLRHLAGMTHLENVAYGRSNGDNGISLLLAYAEKSVTIDASWIEKKNAGYYASRVARNADRRAAADSTSLCTAMSVALNAVQKAREELQRAEAQLEVLTSHGRPFAADQYEWRKLSGEKSPS